MALLRNLSGRERNWALSSPIEAMRQGGVGFHMGLDRAWTRPIVGILALRLKFDGVVRATQNAPNEVTGIDEATDRLSKKPA